MVNEKFFKGKRIFLTGHTGFKGSWMCILLNRWGAEVHGYALEAPSNPSLYETTGVEKLIKTSTIADIRDYGKLLETIQKVQPEIVIHMAAQPLVRESYINPIATYEINVMGTVNLFEAVRHTDSVKVLLNVTTDKSYENKEWDWGYRENEPMNGYDPYSNSKSCSELVTSSFRNSFFNPAEYGKKHHVAVASARAGNVIGGGDWADDRLIPDFIRSLTNGTTIQIRSPYAIRPWQHVLEPISGYLTLCQKLYQDGVKYAEGWNFGPNETDAKPVAWIADKFCELWGEGMKYEIDKNPHPHEANYLKLDCSKAKAHLQWEPRWELEKTIKSIIEWTKAHRSGEDMYAVCLSQIEDFFTTRK